MIILVPGGHSKKSMKTVIPNLVPEFGKDQKKKILNRECKTQISHIFSKSEIGTAIRGNDFSNLNCSPQNKDIENIIQLKNMLEALRVNRTFSQ